MACFDAFHMTSGAMRPEAFEKCESIVQPEPLNELQQSCITQQIGAVSFHFRSPMKPIFTGKTPGAPASPQAPWFICAEDQIDVRWPLARRRGRRSLQLGGLRFRCKDARAAVVEADSDPRYCDDRACAFRP